MIRLPRLAHRSLIRRALTTLLLALSVCQPLSAAELLVYAGAGLRPVIDKLAKLYEQQSGNRVLLEYGGSGQILTRYLASQRGDLFIPGSALYVDKLKAQDKVLESTDLVTHTPVLGISRSSQASIEQFSDLARPGVRVGLGDPKAMALGRTAEQILDASGIGDEIRANTRVRAGTVKQLALYLLRGEVDAAIIGRTDAVLNADKVRMLEIPAQWYTPEIVPVALLSTATAPEQARAFATLLASEVGLAAFTDAGFLPLSATAQ